MGKLLDALQEVAEAAKCIHTFEFIRDFPQGNGIVGRCLTCKCRFTAFPGTAHYDEIVAAKEMAKT